MKQRFAVTAAITVGVVVSVCLSGCGFDVQSPDLFLLTRTGQGSKLTLLVSDGGTISCNGAKPKPIPDSMLISARDLADNLAGDGSAHLTIPARAGEVYYYRIKVQQGTVSFPDRSAAKRSELAQSELLAAQAAQQICHLGG
jgi:hypothetical protein